MTNYPSLNDSLKLEDPAPDWMWTISVSAPQNIYIDRLRILDANFPFSYTEPSGRYRAGSYIYLPTHSNIDQIAVNFYETENFDILQLIQFWDSLVIDSNGNYGLPKDYMGIATLINYDMKGNPRLQCDLEGVWPARLADWSLNYTSSGHLTVNVNFSVNDSQFSFIGASGQTIIPSPGGSLSTSPL